VDVNRILKNIKIHLGHLKYELRGDVKTGEREKELMVLIAQHMST